MTSNKRLLIVQYTGDYREAVHRFVAGGDENYASQRYSVDSVAAMVPLVEEVSVLVALTEKPYDEVLPNGVRGIGAGCSSQLDIKTLLNLIEKQRPTDLVICMPHKGLLRWAIQNKVRALGLLADSFPSNNLRLKLHNWQIAKLFNHPRIEWVANHNINASLALQSIGVDPEKIVPWDWVSKSSPDQFAPKKLAKKETYSLFYAGSIMEDKGVGDLIRAIPLLKQRGVRAIVRIAGRGDINPFTRLAAELGVEAEVKFLGMVPNKQVILLMNEADAVVIPSRHVYPEGLPMTIYESLCSRTPIIASDHPMFAGKLRDGESALIFPASQAASLADRIAILFGDSEMYAQLSSNSAEAWQNIQIPVKFGEFLRRWVSNSTQDREWLQQYSLASGVYNQATP
jgi:glycosyltransferase involved in cell wall biosynthesis